MYQIVSEDAQHKAGLSKGPDTISQGHLPGVTPPAVCRRVARKPWYAPAWIQLRHVLRVGGRDAAQPASCHHLFCAFWALTGGTTVPLARSSINLCWQVLNSTRRLHCLHAKHSPCCWKAVPVNIARKCLPGFSQEGTGRWGTEWSHGALTYGPQPGLWARRQWSRTAWDCS